MSRLLSLPVTRFSISQHGSPHVASFLQTGIAVLWILGFWFFNKDPYLDVFVLLAVLGTFTLLIVQTVTMGAVFNCFRNHHPEENVWRTKVAPIVGGVGMLGVVILMCLNLDTAAGPAASSLLSNSSPTSPQGSLSRGRAWPFTFGRPIRLGTRLSVTWFSPTMLTAPSFTTTAEDGTDATASASPVAAAPASQTSEVSGNAASVWGTVLSGAGFVLGAAALGLVLAGRRIRAAK